MSNYLVHMNQDFLSHHGVDGMEWGKRNGPPYPLNKEGKAALKEQKKAAKLDSYKVRETIKLQKRFRKNEIQGEKHADKNAKRIEKEISKAVINDKKLNKAINRYQSDITEDLWKQGKTMLEMAKVKNMTIAEMEKERKAVGVAVASSIGGTLASIGLVTALKLPIAFIYTPNIANIKTNQRINGDEAGKLLELSGDVAKKGTQEVVKESLKRSGKLPKQDMLVDYINGPDGKPYSPEIAKHLSFSTPKSTESIKARRDDVSKATSYITEEDRKKHDNTVQVKLEKSLAIKNLNKELSQAYKERKRFFETNTNDEDFFEEQIRFNKKVDKAITDYFGEAPSPYIESVKLNAPAQDIVKGYFSERDWNQNWNNPDSYAWRWYS